MLGQEECPFISKLKDTTVVDLNNLSELIPEVIAKKPLIVNQQKYNKFRQQEGVVGHPDLFYRIGQGRKQVSKFGFQTLIGITPIVLNESFFAGTEDFSDLIPFTLVRANSEIKNILSNIETFFDPNSPGSLYEQNNIQAWTGAFIEAEKAGKFDRFVAFYQETLKTADPPLSADEKYNQQELELLNLALNKYRSKDQPQKKGIFGFFLKKK